MRAHARGQHVDSTHGRLLHLVDAAMGDRYRRAAPGRRARAGVAFVAGRPFFADGRSSPAMRLSFSRMADDRIEEGVRRLAEAVDTVRP